MNEGAPVNVAHTRPPSHPPTHLALKLGHRSLQHHVLLLLRRELLLHEPELVGDVVHALGHGDGHPAGRGGDGAPWHTPSHRGPSALITTRNAPETRRREGTWHSTLLLTSTLPDDSRRLLSSSEVVAFAGWERCWCAAAPTCSLGGRPSPKRRPRARPRRRRRGRSTGAATERATCRSAKLKAWRTLSGVAGTAY